MNVRRFVGVATLIVAAIPVAALARDCDEVKAEIVSALQVTLDETEQMSAARRYTDSVEAYDAFLRGWEQLWQPLFHCLVRCGVSM